MENLNKKDISVIGFGIGSAFTSLLLNENKIAHNFFILENQINPLDINPISNPIISGTTMETEKLFLNADFFRELIFIKEFSFSFFGRNFEPTLKVSGNYKIPAYAMDNRLKYSFLLDIIKKLNFSKIVYCNQAQIEKEIKRDGVKILGGGKSYVSYFKPQKNIQTDISSSRKIFFFNVNVNPEKLKQIDKASFFYAKDSGEILIYPFKHKDGYNALNITIEIIKDSKFDIFNYADDSLICFNKAKELIKQFSTFFYDLIKKSDIIEKTISKTEVVPHYKNPINTYSQKNILFGIGDSVCLNDPLTGQGYNNSLKMSKKIAEFIPNFISSDNDIILENYLSDTNNLIKILYELNLNLTIGNDNKLLPILMNLASKNNSLASLLGETFDNVELLSPWYYNEYETDKLIQKFKNDG